MAAWMNEIEVEEAVRRHAGSDILGPATQTLQNLVDWTNRHSDGWPYWRKPAHAAGQLQQLLVGDGSWDYRTTGVYAVQASQVRKSYRPIKAFLTRYAAVVATDGDRPSIIEP